MKHEIPKDKAYNKDRTIMKKDGLQENLFELKINLKIAQAGRWKLKLIENMPVLLMVIIVFTFQQTFAAEPRIVKVGSDDHFPVIFQDKGGVAQGLYVDILTEIGRQENIRFEYDFGTWADSLNLIKSGKIDLLPGVAYTNERLQFMDYSNNPILTVWGELYALKSSEIKSIFDVSGKRIGVIKTDINAKNFLELIRQFHINCELVELAGYEDVFKAVKSKTVDAGVVGVSYGASKQGEYGLRSTGVVFNPYDLYVSTTKGKNQDLILIIDKYLNEWRNQDISVLSNAKQKWIYGSVGTVAVLPDWMINVFVFLAIIIAIAITFIMILKLQVQKATKMLRETESKQARMIANIGDVIVIIDQNGINRYKSPNIEKLFGWKPEDVVGASTWDNVHPDDLESTREFFEKRMHKPDAVGTMECRYRCKDGSYKWIEFTGINLFHDPDIKGLLGNYQDITERKRAEKALIEKEALFRGLFDHMTSGSAVYEVRNDGSKGKDYIIRGFNRKSLEIEGKTLDEVIGRSLFDLRPNIDDYGLIPAMKKVWENGNPVYYPTKIYQDGRFSNYYENHIFKLPSGEIVTLYNDVTDEKNQERELQESERKYRVLFDTFPLGITVSDQSGNIVESNAVSEKLLGIAKTEHETRTIDEPTWRIIRPDGAPMPMSEYASVRALKEKRQIENVEMGIVKSDGEITWINVSAAPLHLEKYGVVVTYGDITERKRVEVALRKTEEKFRSYIANAPDGVFIADEKGRYVEVNQAACEITGYSEKELLNKSIPDLLQKSELEKGIQHFKEVQQNGSARDEIGFVTKSGENRFWQVAAVKLFDTRFLGFVKDITERKRYEAALLESQTRYQTAQRMGHVGNWEYNLNTGQFWGSDEAKRIYGFDPNQDTFSTEAVESCIPERDRVHQALIDLIEKGREYNLEFQIFPVNSKQPKTLISLAELRKDDKGLPMAVYGVIQDITERKQAEAEKEKLQAQLTQAQKMESVGRLAGGVAHDFNNMLGVILGHAELALELSEENSDICSDLKEIQTAAQRSADLTKQLLTFARKQIIEPKMLNLNQTVKQMITMLQRLIGEDIDLLWKPCEALWPVKMDPSQIDQILANLCVNARDAITDVGKITIETDMVSFDEAYCTEHAGFIPGDFVMLGVSDNGSGMNKETLKNLFEPFFTTKEMGKGTGLGLAMIYGIVKQNSGFINVYSEPGKGTTFKIYLPRLVADEDTDKAVPDKKAAPGGNETVLIVEDEPAILNMTRMMLERKGYSVLSAATPADAIEIAGNHTNKIHLLMTDVVMPGMNGRDLARQLTALYPDIKLLFMSGYTANVIAHQGVLDEGVAFIQKPFSMADLAEKLRGVLDMPPDKAQG